MKDQRFTPSGGKNIAIKKSEFVTKDSIPLGSIKQFEYVIA